MHLTLQLSIKLKLTLLTCKVHLYILQHNIQMISLVRTKIIYFIFKKSIKHIEANFKMLVI